MPGNRDFAHVPDPVTHAHECNKSENPSLLAACSFPVCFDSRHQTLVYLRQEDAPLLLPSPFTMIIQSANSTVATTLNQHQQQVEMRVDDVLRLIGLLTSAGLVVAVIMFLVASCFAYCESRKNSQRIDSTIDRCISIPPPIPCSSPLAIVPVRRPETPPPLYETVV